MYHVFALAEDVEKSFGEKLYYSTDFCFVCTCGLFKKSSFNRNHKGRVQRDLLFDWNHIHAARRNEGCQQMNLHTVASLIMALSLPLLLRIKRTQMPQTRKTRNTSEPHFFQLFLTLKIHTSSIQVRLSSWTMSGSKSQWKSSTFVFNPVEYRIRDSKLH